MSEMNSGDQASGQSLVDRIAAQFDEPETEPQEQAAPETVEDSSEEVEAPQTEAVEEVEIEYDGDRYRIPKKLEKGFMQERDYTQKAQDLAEQRKRLEQSEAVLKLADIDREFNQAVADDAQQVQMLDGYIKQLKGQDFDSMSAEDGFKQWMRIQSMQERRNELDKAIQSKRKEFQQRYDQSVSELRGKTREALTKLAPSFTDESFNGLKDYANSQGFTGDAFDRIALDTKSALVLWKAQRYDQLQAEKSSAVKKVESPVIKPGSSNPMPQSVKDRLALNKAFKNAKTKGERDALMQKRVEAMF